MPKSQTLSMLPVGYIFLSVSDSLAELHTRTAGVTNRLS